MSASAFYMDSGNGGSTSGCGVQDQDDCQETVRVYKHIEALGFENAFYYLSPGDQHSEAYWGARFNQPMLDLYPAPR